MNKDNESLRHKVYVATYEHKHGNSVRVFASAESAEAWRQEIAADEWDGVGWFDDRKRPDDPTEVADAYFERMMASGREYFGVDECEVEP